MGGSTPGGGAHEKKLRTRTRAIKSQGAYVKKLCISLFVFLEILYAAQFAYAGTREPAVAGQFYPDKPKELSDYVDSLLSKTALPIYKGEPVAFLVPHAGYPFSGPVAAYAFKVLAKQDYKTVILVGTAHAYPLKSASLFPKGAFKTPLGEVKIDEETALKLMKRHPEYTQVVELAHLKEHSIEVELPFLQRILTDFQIVPILVGDANFETVIEIGNAIGEATRENIERGKSTIIVASSDLSHYPNRVNAERVDRQTLDAIKSLEPKTLWDTDKKMMADNVPGLVCTMCGNAATMAVMQAAKVLGADTTAILKYANSADSVFGDINKVVGYGAVAFTKTKNVSNVQNPKFQISIEDKKKFLKLARKTLENFARMGEIPKIEGNESAAKPVAVFVTLMEKGELRGCMGSPEPVYALQPAIRQFTYLAASGDPRFSSVKEDEITKIDIEISILSGSKKVKSADEIESKRDGVIIEYKGHRGLFLPQVWETLKSKEEFLNELASQKAGLPSESWRNPDASLYTFTVQSFSEKEFASTEQN